MKSRNPLTVEVYRGPVVESRHHVMAVVVDEHGRIANYFGNTDYVVYPRSSIKMLQAIPFVESGAIDKLGLDDSNLALACSSHKGEKIHLDVASKWMEKIKVADSAFACGAEYPASEASRNEMIRKGQPPTHVCHNCSGKHLGMMSTSIALGEKFENYHKFEHPVQARLRKLMTELTKIDHDKTPFGIDGCGIPTYAIPLDRLAIAMSQLIHPAPSSTRRTVVEKIVSACRKHPLLVGGSDEFVSVANEKTNGRLILKAGAEGTYAGVYPEKGFSFAVKAQDGSKRAAEAVVAHLLRQLSWINDAEAQELRKWLHPVIKNSRDERVGEIRVHKDA